MNRTEFVIAIAIILFIAFGLGWFAYWLIHRFTRVSKSDMGELERMARSGDHLSPTKRSGIDQSVGPDRSRTSAAMEGLREARHEAEELRGYIDKVNAQK